MAKKEGSTSKRQTVREQRLRRERRQRISIILGVTLVALVIAALVFIPNYLESRRPVGDIVTITPKEYPNANGREMGLADAPVTIEVFEDFQCPACANYTTQIEPQVIENLIKPGQVHYIYRQFPVLDDRLGGGESDQAANASMCAAEQDRFWDYHEIVYANWDGENQGAFRDARLLAFAEALDLDMEQFRSCFNANKYRDEINADLDRGTQIGVQGTPSVFVNGELLTPGFVPTYEQIAEAVQKNLPQ